MAHVTWQELRDLFIEGTAGGITISPKHLLAAIDRKIQEKQVEEELELELEEELAAIAEER